MDEIMSINNISKSFNTLKALDNVSFSIYKGQVVGLIGFNGAGKSTLISIILGLVKPDKGSVRLFNKDSIDKENLKNVGVMLQNVTMPENLKVCEWLKMVQVYCDNAYSIDEVLKIADLEDEKNSLASKLSGGKQRRLQFALSIIGKPKVLFLDEPTVGMDFQSKRKFWDYINVLIKRGTTIILTSHDLVEVEEVAQRIIIIDKGRILADKPMEKLKEEDAYSTIKINKRDINLDLIDDNTNYKIQDDKVIIYPKDIDKVVRNLLKSGVSYDAMNVSKGNLEQILDNIIKKEG